MATQSPIDISAMLPAVLTAPDITEAEFLDLCDKFPDALLEYTPEGTILIMPPTDPETSAKVVSLVTQLSNWAEAEGNGIVIGPDGGFFLPGGSRRSPDAAWFDRARWQASKRPGTRFPEFAPEFLVEVRSPNDKIRLLREKMVEYINAGVPLGWLIDPREKTVSIYRAGVAPETLENPATIAGEGPVAGFVLTLRSIFAN